MAKSYAVQIKEINTKIAGKVDNIVHDIVVEVTQRMVNRSPVADSDLWKHPPKVKYVGGRFKANWMHNTDSVGTGTFEDIDPTGAASMQRVMASVPKDAAGKKHYISNNLPYATMLENGWSTQAPAGMVGLTAMEFPSLVREVVSKYGT